MLVQLIPVVMRHEVVHDIFVELSLIYNVRRVCLSTSAETCIRLCKNASFSIWWNTECILTSGNFVALKFALIRRFNDKTVLEIKMRVTEYHKLVFSCVLHKLEVVSCFPVVGFLPDVNACILTVINFDNIVLLFMVELTISGQHLRQYIDLFMICAVNFFKIY